jgi:hypothetical protein
MDLMVLHSAYGNKMRSYSDTIIVVFDDDPGWQEWPRYGKDQSGRDVRGISQCVKVHLY